MRLLREEVQVLRDAIDELREDVVHALRNPSEPPVHFHLTSMALDPTDPEFGRKINAVPAEILARLREEVVREAAAAHHALEGDDDSELEDEASSTRHASRRKSRHAAQRRLF